MSDALLGRALGNERVRLLGVADLQTALLQAEIALFAGTDQPVSAALPNAWYLHALAMSAATQDAAFEARRGDAGRVAAHVFDLHLQQHGEVMALPTRLRYIVAAQSGYHVGAIAPNAMAMAKVPPTAVADLGDGPGVMTLLAAQFLFGQNLKALGELLEGWRDELSAVVGSLWDGEDSPLDALERTMAGIGLLREYLLTGGTDRIGSATNEFNAAIQNPYSRWDADSRWVAALLTDFGSILERTSIWNIVEPGSPVGRALTLGEPPIYAMWPPQAEFLVGTPSPFDQSSRRMILSLPTSAGKTLVAQILTLNFLATQELGACVIAPTHALCREIITALNSRLGLLATYASDGGNEGGADPLSTSAAGPRAYPRTLRCHPQVGRRGTTRKVRPLHHRRGTPALRTTTRLVPRGDAGNASPHHPRDSASAHSRVCCDGPGSPHEAVAHTGPGTPRSINSVARATAIACVVRHRLRRRRLGGHASAWDYECPAAAEFVWSSPLVRARYNRPDQDVQGPRRAVGPTTEE